MPNTISLAKKYSPLIDEKYRAVSTVTSLLTPASSFREGANAHEILVRKISLKGLGNYSRNSGYTNNAVTIAWETMAYNYDRGTKITMDTMDNEETMGDSFLAVQRDLQELFVVPEGDAFTYATIAQKSGITTKEETFTDASDFLEGLITATTGMDELKVGQKRELRATPTLLNSVMALDTTKSREILGKFSKIIPVPQTEFYTKINLLSNEEEEEFGYEKASDGADINFMIIEPSAVIIQNKHVVSDVIPASANPDADSDISKYRKYGIVYVYDNKVAGVYVSHKPISTSL